MEIIQRLKERIRKYFSGKLALVQITAGIGALAGRSLAVYFADGLATWNIVVLGMVGSFTGYVGAYAFGYWVAFRKDYGTLHRSMPFDIFRLQIVEQLPNLGTVVVSGVTQGALIGSAGMPPVLAANLGSLFGPHKIVNLVAMLTSNSLKRAWVDGTWRPLAVIRSLGGRVLGLLMTVGGLRSVRGGDAAAVGDEPEWSGGTLGPDPASVTEPPPAAP